MRNCKYCGAPLDVDSIFCSNCGKKIEKQGRTCPKCGNNVFDDSVFCEKCGTRLDECSAPNIDYTMGVTSDNNPKEESEIIYDWEEEEKNRTRKSIILSIVLILILITSSCVIYKNYNNSNLSTINLESERKPILLLGTINEKIEFSMRLQFVGNEIEGTEHYDKLKTKDSLIIKGSIDENNNMVLYEYNNLVECGKYEGHLTNFTFTGMFTNSHGKEMPFTSQIISEKELLGNIDNDAKSNIEEDKVRCRLAYSQLLDKFVNERQSEEYMDESYFLFDITGDKIPELWLEVTDWYGDFFHLLYVYTISDGQLELLYKGNAGHPSDHIFYMGGNYIILDYSFRGTFARFKYEYKRGKIIEKKIFHGVDTDESIQGYYELTEPMVSTSDLTNKELLNNI